jgi:hypothetical protein
MTIILYRATTYRMSTPKTHLLIHSTQLSNDNDPQAKACKLTNPGVTELKVAPLSIRKVFPIHMYSPSVHSNF